MDFITDLFHQFRQYISPETLANAGLLVLFLVVFAETGLMVGFFLPGDSLLFTVGLLSATGHLANTSIFELLTVLIAAAIVGDQVGYLFGRKVGPALFKREESFLFKPKYIEQTRAFYDRHGGKTIVLGRFVPIVRTFAPIIAGVAKFDYRTFVIYNVVGGVVWVLSMTLAGYFLGVLFPGIKKYVEFIVVGIILLSVVPIITTYLKERKRAKGAAAEVPKG